MMNMQIEGALTVKEYLNQIKAKELKSDKLVSGETVYFVENCNITSYEVYGVFIVENEERAVLIAKGSCGFTNVPLEELGINLFESLEEAQNEVANRLPEIDCILGCEMKVQKFKGYTAAKKGNVMTAFYAVLDNGMVYFKDYFGCGRLVQITANEADVLLAEEVEQYDLTSKKAKVMPELQNMYKVVTDVGNGWKYAEMSYPFTCVS